MLLQCKGLQKVTVKNQRKVTKEEVNTVMTSLRMSMDRMFHRMKFNTILSEASVLDPRFKTLAFNNNRALDEALQRVTAAATRFTPTQQAQPAVDEGAVGRVAPEEAPTSAIWQVFDDRRSGRPSKASSLYQCDA